MIMICFILPWRLCLEIDEAYFADMVELYYPRKKADRIINFVSWLKYTLS